MSRAQLALEQFPHSTQKKGTQAPRNLFRNDSTQCAIRVGGQFIRRLSHSA